MGTRGMRFKESGMALISAIFLVIGETFKDPFMVLISIEASERKQVLDLGEYLQRIIMNERGTIGSISMETCVPDFRTSSHPD